MNYVTNILCEFALSLDYNSLSEETVIQTKKFITDYFASSLAGFSVNRTFNDAVLNTVQSLGGNPQSSVLLEKNKYPAPAAAFVNASYAHGADLDDGNRMSAGHIGTHVISSVFALAEQRNLCWKDVIAAINVGYDFFNRIGGSAQPDLYNKGFHSTGVVGSIASGAACARLLKLNKKSIYDSISIAAIQSGGLIIIDESGQSCKPINPANAAKTGVFSALLAEQGIDSPQYPLESGKGWYHAFTDNVKENYITRELGHTFTINQSYLKIYPSCRHTHSAIDAVLELRKKFTFSKNFDVKSIKKINVYIYPNAIKSAGNIVLPKNRDEAKFSIAFSVSVALFKGIFTLEDLELSNISPEIKYLAESVRLIPDRTMENPEKGIRGAQVEIVLQNHVSLKQTVLIPKGEGNNPLTWEDLERKLFECAKPLTQQYRAKKLLDFCKTIDPDKNFTYPGFILLKQTRSDALTCG